MIVKYRVRHSFAHSFFSGSVKFSRECASSPINVCVVFAWMQLTFEIMVPQVIFNCHFIISHSHTQFPVRLRRLPMPNIRMHSFVHSLGRFLRSFVRTRLESSWKRKNAGCSKHDVHPEIIELYLCDCVVFASLLHCLFARGA